MHYNKAWRGIEKVWKWMLGKFHLLQILKTFSFIQAWVRTYRQNDNKSFVYQTLMCFLFLISWWTDHHNKTRFFLLRQNMDSVEHSEESTARNCLNNNFFCQGPSCPELFLPVLPSVWYFSLCFWQEYIWGVWWEFVNAVTLTQGEKMKDTTKSERNVFVFLHLSHDLCWWLGYFCDRIEMQ